MAAGNINDALNQLGQIDSSKISKELEQLSSNEQLMEQMSSIIVDNPQLAEMSKKLIGDPRVNQFKRDNPEINKKQALQLQKQINKAAHNRKMKKAKIEGVLINESRNLKPITIYLKDDMPDKQAIANHLQSRSLFMKETDKWIVFYDGHSKCKNKRVMKMFPDVVGGKVIILAKEGDLSTNEILEYEKGL